MKIGKSEKKHLRDRYLANLKGHIISKDPYYSGFKSLSKVRVIIFIDLDLPPELTGTGKRMPSLKRGLF